MRRNIKQFFEKKFWRRGSGEIIGFLSILPVIVLLLVMLISIAQMGSIKERLEYTTYVAGRAAVVSKDLNSAKEAAYTTAQNDLLNFSDTFVPGSLKVKLQVIQGTGTGKKWEKGNYVTCTVSVKVKTLTPLINGKKSCNLTMMIESPTDDLDMILP